jgi:pimeloyl-ACP methyl ester carboxylesterase
MDIHAPGVHDPLCRVMSEHATDARAASFEVAERRLFDACAIEVTSRRVRLADPPLAVRVLEAGDGPPLLFVHRSGMSASTWAPLLPYLAGYRLIAFDLPGFGLSSATRLTTRGARCASTRLRSSRRCSTRSTSNGSRSSVPRWAGCGRSAWLSMRRSESPPWRRSGVPAVALPGMRGDPAFTALSTPGVRQLVARIGSPSVAVTRRALARGAIGPRATELAPDGFFDVVHECMRQPGVRTAMLSHMWLAMRLGRPRPENFLSDAELQQIAAPVLMIWGDEDPYGGPEIGRRASALIPDAHLEVMPGRHAPFLDDTQRCGALIDELLRRVAASADHSRSDEATRTGTE